MPNKAHRKPAKDAQNNGRRSSKPCRISRAYERHQRHGADLLRAPANVRERGQRLADTAFSLHRAFQVARERELIVPVKGIGKFFADKMPQQILTSLFRDVFAE